MPRRMSVQPTASHTRPPLGVGIIGASTRLSPPLPGLAGPMPESAPATNRKSRSRLQPWSQWPRQNARQETTPEGSPGHHCPHGRASALRPPRRSRPVLDLAPAASGRSGSHKRPLDAPPRNNRSRRERCRNDRPLLLKAEPPPPFGAGENMNLRHPPSRIDANIGVGTSAKTSHILKPSGRRPPADGYLPATEGWETDAQSSPLPSAMATALASS